MQCLIAIRVFAGRHGFGARLARLVRLGPYLCILLILGQLIKAQSIVVTPSSLSFFQVVDLEGPPEQIVQVTASDGSHIPFTIPWPFCTGLNARICLVASPTSGVTPSTIGISAQGGILIGATGVFNEPWPLVISEDLPFVPNPPSLARAGNLKGTITLTPPPEPLVTSVVNAISQLPGVSPGELVTISGENLGSSDVAMMQCPILGPPCHFPTTLGNTKILFNGAQAAFVGYSNPGSITAIVPYGLAGPNVKVVIQHFSLSTTVTLPLTETSPAICGPSPGPPYTLDPPKWCCPPFGRGVCSPGMFLNGDYSVNGPGNPAPIGSPVLFVANGSGEWNSGVLSGGLLFGGEVPLAPVSVTIGGQQAQVQYAKSGLAASVAISYNLQVRALVPPGIAPGPQPVVLTVGDASNLPQQVMLEVESAQPPRIDSVLNAASYQTPLSPGEFVSIFGQGLAAAAAAPILNGDGLPPVSTTVTFNGAYTHLVYTDQGQINALVPYEMAGQSSASVVVSHFGQSAPFTVPLADTSPAIFTLDGSGSGQGAILNVDNTVNSAKRPALAGSVVQIFANGAGLWNQPQPPNLVLNIYPPFPVPLAPVSLTIGGKDAQILYAGGAPGLYFGILQVNAVIPAGLASGPQPLVLKIGENSNAQQQVTVAVQ
ncbi:MAG TPA: IPT/TIG domain-containing protein [Bryobacteraceae bacterium]|nr:IPT/TIG domain-containing protein [Bryobacteraceae bacterium]